MRLLKSHLVILASVLGVTAADQTRVQDIFGRSLDEHGITLVDWEGYLANPLVKFYVFPPTNAVFPASAKLSGDGPRLYFNAPGTVSSNGPAKTIFFSSVANGIPVSLSIFPDRDGLDEDYTLTIAFSGANGVKQTNTIPIHVIDQDRERTNDFVVTANFDRDITSFFTNATRRALAQQAANDWAYFFAAMNLDAVPTGAETTYIWSNNFNGGYTFTNTNAYTGYLLYPYGTINSLHRSGGESSYSGPVQTSGGAPLKIKRSGGFEAEIYGNYNTLGWLLLTNDDQWLVTGNLGDELNDFYSIAHHEIGHALIFNTAHPGFNAAKTTGAFKGSALLAYNNGPAPIDGSDHLNGVIDPDSGQGVFGYEYYGNIPRKRWIITKLDLLAAQEVGYQLRPTSAFAALTFATNTPGPAQLNAPFAFSFTVSGGIPFYHWEVTAGNLPSGIALDPFTGALGGTPTIPGSYPFTIRVRDYHEGSPGVTRDVTITVSSVSQPRLNLVLAGAGADREADLQLEGAVGMEQTIQASTNLLDWMPIATNVAVLSPFQTSEKGVLSFRSRFYRAWCAE